MTWPDFNDFGEEKRAIMPRSKSSMQVGSLKEGPVRIGIVGTGFISRNFAMFVSGREDFKITRVLTRRPVDSCQDHPNCELVTNSLDELLENADIVFECSGDPIYATDVIERAYQAHLPVVTMNTEFHVTAGSYFVGKGLISEAEGDQPGCQAALKEKALELGFRPLVYGNMKGFQNVNPTRSDMEYWSKRQGTSIPMTTSFTDGTKIQFEQALVANGCGATFAVPGMLGPEIDDLISGAEILATRAQTIGMPISDYLLSLKLTHGVFIVAKHDSYQQAALRYYKMGDGPYYTLVKPNIFVHLEVLKTIKSIVHQKRVLLNNSDTPRISVATVAKRQLEPGTKIKQGIGSFDVRGVGIEIVNNAGHLPIGLVSNAVIKRRIEPEQMLSVEDVDIPESLAFRAWREIERRVIANNEQHNPREIVV